MNTALAPENAFASACLSSISASAISQPSAAHGRAFFFVTNNGTDGPARGQKRAGHRAADFSGDTCNCVHVRSNLLAFAPALIRRNEALP